MRGRADDERGAVTAETAMAMPLLAALTVGLVWLLVVGAAQVRTVDAAREAARMLARGESQEQATSVARRVAPEGAQVQVTHADGQVRVSVEAVVGPPGGVFDVAARQVRSTAVAALEPGVAGQGSPA